MASLRRAGIGAARQPRWCLAIVLLAVTVPCLAAVCSTRAAYGLGFGLGSGTLTGIVTECTPAEIAANGGDSNSSQVVTVYVQNQAGLTVASPANRTRALLPELAIFLGANLLPAETR